eukprot:TRINITY_DN5490_c0_g1_i1.p1 TRINITY_DN5490_c0_g1~~TRINITY_DN5490_c0_g1_i1.p1  ORF type:complete len:277 (-),score=58.01 TRINITY_DN5490_c0_g1_i1:158-916(-)
MAALSLPTANTFLNSSSEQVQEPAVLSRVAVLRIISRSALSTSSPISKILPPLSFRASKERRVLTHALTEEKERQETSTSSLTEGELGQGAAASSSVAEAADVDTLTRKFGLEVGLWNALTRKSKEANGETEQTDKLRAEGVSKKTDAKELLARYGGAYLATSISLSLVSFALCYWLVSVGVNVSALLDKIGIHTDETGEAMSAVALAYAAHKAASPIRFPPTVFLTPLVADWLRTRQSAKSDEDAEGNDIN